MMRQLHALAIEGDTAAARLLIERCIGKPSDEPRPFGIDLGDIDTAAGVAAAMHVVASAAANGDITAPDAMAIVAVLRGVSDATTFAELETRIASLEGRNLL